MHKRALIFVIIILLSVTAYGFWRMRNSQEGISGRIPLSKEDRAKLIPQLRTLVMGDFATLATVSKETSETNPSWSASTIQYTVIYYSQNSRGELKEQYQDYFDQLGWSAIGENKSDYSLSVRRNRQNVFVDLQENGDVTQVRVVYLTTQMR